MKRIKLIVICGIIIFLVIFAIVIISNKTKKINYEKRENDLYEYDESEDVYVIYDKNGEEIIRTNDRTEVHNWEIDPDYDLEMTPYSSKKAEEVEESFDYKTIQ